MYDVIIIGAGASGLMAAATAASKGARVALLEHKDDIGKKILATGNGRCNFTNTDMSVNKFHGSKALIKNGLSQFNYADTIRFFKGLGIPAYDNAGYIYPNSRQAASVVAAFRMELMRLHVDVKTGISITEIRLQGLRLKTQSLLLIRQLIRRQMTGPVTASKQTRAALSPKGLS